MSKPQVDLKNPLAAAVLAFLIPGAGHLYQGRYFKAVLYSVCILGTFFWGMYLGNWRVVYYRWEPGHKTIGYFSQVLVGLPALPAVYQSMRYTAPEPNPFRGGNQGAKLTAIEKPLSANFVGRMGTAEGDKLAIQRITGIVKLQPVTGEFGWEVRGELTGTSEDGAAVSLQLAEPLEIGSEVCGSEEVTYRLLEKKDDAAREFASDRRYLQCRIIETSGGQEIEIGYLEGTIPRGFWNWFEVPLENDALEELHGSLGKLVELARVFTWIAGLLNLLAIWDAFEGPAYGYGDEEDDEGTDSKSESSDESAADETSAQKLAGEVERASADGAADVDESSEAPAATSGQS